MYHVTHEKLDRLIQEYQSARQYAWDHYEELAGRISAHTLYGPMAYGIGAWGLGSFSTKSQRKLVRKTRRKDFAIYELDDQYQLLRVTHMLDYTTIDCVYHCFRLKGTLYACPFRVRDKQKEHAFCSGVIRREGSDGVLFEARVAHWGHIAVEFFQRNSEGKATVTCCIYCQTAMTSAYGLPIDPDAPVGARNSDVSIGCREEDWPDTDFSRHFF